jgi:hypothetical protein
MVAISYRLSLKSTALLWYPLIFVIDSAYDSRQSVSSRVDEFRRSAIWKLTRMVSWLSLVLFALKLLVLPHMIDWWNARAWTPILNVWLMPLVIHPWHIAIALNAALALAMYYFVIEPAPRMLEQAIWKPETLGTGLRVFLIARGILSYYTIAVGIYLTVYAVSKMHGLRWASNLFPW